MNHESAWVYARYACYTRDDRANNGAIIAALRAREFRTRSRLN